VTPLALAGGALAVLPEPLGSLSVPCLAFAHALFALLGDALRALAQWPWASVALPAPPWWAVVAAVAGVAWLLAPPGWPLRALGLTALLPLAALPPQRPATDELWVTALDVGQGMAVLVETRAHVLLYDTGPRYGSEADAGGRVIAPYLRWRGIAAIDTLVVSHLDSDHSGGVPSILAALPVRQLVSSVPAAHPMFGGRPVQRCEDGMSVAWPGGSARVLHPAAEDYGRAGMGTNAMSCVLRVEHAGRTVLLAGDVPARQEGELLARHPRAGADLVTAPHHGSRHSSSAAWVERVAATYVSAQAGYRNRFGHPDPGVVARYGAGGAALWRSDWHGAVLWRLRADGTGVVRPHRWHGARYWTNQPDPRAAHQTGADDDDAETPIGERAGADPPDSP
jgi:competence protein ComEC